MERRIIFVGMHNKPMMNPLDSRTMTGKVIDKMIEQLPGKCVKSNLCNTDLFPKDALIIRLYVSNWSTENTPNANDIVVLLGRWVQKNFLKNIKVAKPNGAKIINLTHPAGIFGTNDKEKYITDSITKIKDKWESYQN